MRKYVRESNELIMIELVYKWYGMDIKLETVIWIVELSCKELVMMQIAAIAGVWTDKKHDTIK